MSTERMKKHLAMLKEPGNEQLLKEHKLKQHENNVKYLQKRKNDSEFLKNRANQSKRRRQRIAENKEAITSSAGIFTSNRSLGKAISRTASTLPSNKTAGTTVLKGVGRRLEISLKTPPRPLMKRLNEKTEQSKKFFALACRSSSQLSNRS